MKLKPSLKARALTAFSLLLVIFAFQNCGKAPVSQLDVGENSQNKIEASQFSKLSVVDESQNSSIKIDLNSGDIEKSQGSSGVERRCLSQSDRNQLSSILFQAEICKPGPVHLAPETVCTMAFQSAYAVLSEGDQSISLGERNTGCAKAVDLCNGQSAIELRGFIDRLKARVDSMVCN